MNKEWTKPRFHGLLLTAFVLNVWPCFAGTFIVTTDTSGLIGEPSGPFSLDFQFIDGSGTGDANNAVEISDFNFNGGSWTGGPTITGGGATGIGVVSLTDTAFFNEVFQGFTPGGTLSFKVTLTGNVDAGGIPDQFSFAILDNSLAEIPTLGLADALVSFDINSANPTFSSFGTDPSRTSILIAAPIVSTAQVPDPAVPPLLTGALWSLGVLFGRPAGRVFRLTGNEAVLRLLAIAGRLVS